MSIPHILIFVVESGTIATSPGCVFSAHVSAGTAAAASLALLANGANGGTLTYLRAPAGQSASRLFGADGAQFGSPLYASLSGAGSVADVEINS